MTKKRHRQNDPGRGLPTKEQRRAARLVAWRPNTAARRAAHKALVLLGVGDDDAQP